MCRGLQKRVTQGRNWKLKYWTIQVNVHICRSVNEKQYVCLDAFKVILSLISLATFYCCLYDAQTGDCRLFEEIQRKKKTKGKNENNCKDEYIVLERWHEKYSLAVSPSMK